MSATRQIEEKPFAAHVKATLVLGTPLVLAQLAQMSIGVTDTIMLGWLGTRELAAGTLAFQTYFLCLIFCLGFAAAMIPLIASAIGKGDERQVRRSARMGLWTLFGLAALFMLPLWFTTDILIALNQKTELAELAGNYMRIAQWSMIPAAVLAGMRSFLTAVERAQEVLWITVFASVLNGLLNYAFIFGNFGAPRLGIEGAAVATVISNSIAVLAIFVLIYGDRRLRPYDLFTRLWRPDWLALWEVLRLGFPISLTILAEVGLFTAASLLIGWLGTIPLAAHGIALQIASVAFMIPLGLSQTASVRVGNAHGRNSTIDIGRAGNAAFVLSFGFAVFTALLLWFSPGLFINLFLDDSNNDAAAVLQYAIPLVWVAAAFQIADALQAVASGNLRGLRDTKRPMILAAVSYWLVGIPAAYVLAFPLKFGGIGVWGGLAVGLTAAAISLSWRFLRRDALGLSKAV